MRILIAAALTALLAYAGAASAQDDGLLYGPNDPAARPGGELTVGALVEPPALDPFHQAADARIQVTVLIYQGLVYEDADGTPRPLLATGWERADDGMSYLFGLRQGVRFHGGQTMTAADVKYSYDYLRDPANGSPGAGDLSAVEEIAMVDDYRVRFVLKRPNAALPIALGNKYGAVVPAGSFDSPDAMAEINRASIGTGPYRLKTWRSNSYLMLERNPDYWQPGLPLLDRISFAYLPNSASLLAALRNARIDLALLLRPQDARQIDAVPGLVVARAASYNQRSIDFNLAYPPVRDRRVRQAMALAIDKREVLEAALGGVGQVIGTVPAGMQARWGVPIEDLPFQTVDLARARALLAEAGHSAGLDIELVTIIGYDWMEPAAVTLAAQLARIGVRVAIKKVELGVWINNWRGRSSTVTLNDWGTAPDPGLLYFRHFRKPPDGYDFRNWNNDAASDLLDRAQAALDDDRRHALYAEFQTMLATELPTLMMFSTDYVTVSRDRVRNYRQHPTGWYFGLVKTWTE